MKTGTMVEYAIKRTKEHLLRFNRLHDQVRSDTLDERGWVRGVARQPLPPSSTTASYRPA
jgi:1,4-alpha-glucan branching enzyme